MSDLMKRLHELEDFSEGVGRLSTADLLGEARDALVQKQARINKLEFLLSYARTCDKEAGQIAWNQQYAGVSDPAADEHGRLHDERCATHDGNRCDCLLSRTPVDEKRQTVPDTHT